MVKQKNNLDHTKLSSSIMNHDLEAEQSKRHYPHSSALVSIENCCNRTPYEVSTET